MRIPQHLIDCDDGALYDTRNPQWHKNPPLRKVYKRFFREIRNAEELKATLRFGPRVFPGGYPISFVTIDGKILSYRAVKDNFRDVLKALKYNARRQGPR